MDHAQRLRQSAGSTPRPMSRNSKTHQSLQTTASSAGDDDLFDSPETVEAFALLEAALDEANFSKSSLDLRQQKEMLFEPPTTAARFISIESAIGEPKSATGANSHAQISQKPATSRFGSRHSRHSSSSSSSSSSLGPNVLRKRSLCPRPQSMSHSSTPATTASSTEIDFATGLGRSVDYTDRGRWLSMNFAIDSATSTTRTTSRPLKPIPEISHRQSDIFRSHDAAEMFADQTYRSAREKYF